MARTVVKFNLKVLIEFFIGWYCVCIMGNSFRHMYLALRNNFNAMGQFLLDFRIRYCGCGW